MCALRAIHDGERMASDPGRDPDATCWRIESIPYKRIQHPVYPWTKILNGDLMSTAEPTRAKAKSPAMDAYLQRHDLVYEAAPLEWDEGLPLGNGAMGAIIWGSGSPLHLSLSHYGQWDLRTPTWQDDRYSYKHFTKLYRQGRIAEVRNFFSFRLEQTTPSRLPALRLETDFGAQPVKFEARLALSNATAAGRIRFTKGHVDWEAYVASEQDVFVMDMRRSGRGKPLIRLAKDILTPEAKANMKSRRFPPAEEGRSGDIHWVYQDIPENGGELLAWRRIAKGRNSETLLATLVVGESKADLLPLAQERLNAAAESMEAIRRKHVASWRAYWKKSFLHIPDHRLESLYYAEIYKFGCCSKPGKYAISLQGPWAADNRMADWHGGLHGDMNLQQCYWPAYASNRLEWALPICDWFESILPHCQEECRKFFQCDGAFLQGSSAINGARMYGWETCEQWPGNGAWLAWHFWLHYLYSRDDAFLKDRAYPMLREFMTLYVNIVEKGKDGLYHLPLGASPEYSHDSPAAWGSDVTADLALIRALGGALLWTVKHLSLSEPEAARWRDVLDNLAPYPSAETARPGLHEEWEKQRIELGMPNDPWLTELPPKGLFVMHEVPYYFSHPHLTHLLAIYPLGLLTIEGDKAEQETVLDSIRTLWHFGLGRWAGQVMGLASCLASRAKMPAMALQMLQNFADYFITANTFHVNGDYRETGMSAYTLRTVTLESGFGFAGALMEMLLQSWGGKIRLFTGVSPKWRDIAFRDLRAEGAFLVSAKREKGQTAWVEIHSEKGGPCAVENPFLNGTVTLENLATGKRSPLKGPVLKFPTRAGETLRLSARKLTAGDLRITTPSAAAYGEPPFGVKE